MNICHVNIYVLKIISVKLAEIKNEMVSPKVTEVAKIEEKRCSPVYKEVVAITPKKVNIGDVI